jgi:predicted outer membrane repeat protein
MMKRKFSWVVILLTIALLTLPTLSLLGQATPAPQDVFGAAPQAADANTSRGRGVIRARTATLNRAAVPDTQAAVSLNQLRLNLFPDVNLLADQLRTESNQAVPNGYVWVGNIPGDPYSQVVLSIAGGQMAGYVQTQTGLYEIKNNGSLQIITELNPAAFDTTGTDAVAHPPRPAGPRAAAPDVQPLAAGQTAVVDMLVVYTPAARDYLGGSVAAPNEVQAAITAANQSYLNSGVNIRMNLAHTELVDYTESGDMGTDLDNVTYGGSPFQAMDNVLTLRDTYNADLVTLVTYKSGSSYCGLGWQFTADDLSAPEAFAPYAFHVVSADCMVGNLTLAHEAGHNMGANHDIANTSGGPDGAYPYAYGYLDPTGKFRTVMSYNSCSSSPCPRVSYFSNITRTLDGKPLGNVNANNAQVLNNTAPYIAAFRSGSTTPVLLTPTPVPPVYVPTAMPPSTAAPGCSINVSAGSTDEFINAINTANSNGDGEDIICLAPNSVYLFKSAGYTFQTNATALPPISTAITILGRNSTLIWDGAGYARFFGVDGSNPQAQLTLDSLNLLNGRVNYTVNNYGNGGAIYNYYGTLNLNNVTFRNNIAGNLGGAIYNLGPTSITDSKFYGNSAYSGGAIYAASNGSNPASVVITRTLLQENDAMYGSAIYAYYTTALVYANGSCFIHNTNMSVYNNGAPTMNLGSNWWNASYGPTLYNGNTQGAGDRLGPTGITYTPFLTGVPPFCAGPSLANAAPSLNYNTTGRPTLTWTALTWASSYQVQVATSAAFTNVEFNQIVGATQVTIPPENTLPEGTHYWRVRGCTSPTACAGAWSTPQVLTVDLP